MKSTSLSAGMVALIFNGVPIPNLADNAASLPSTALWMALYPADPGEAGGTATLNSTVTFPQCRPRIDPFNQTAITHLSIGLSSEGPGTLLYIGQLAVPIKVGQGSIPSIYDLSFTEG